MKNVKVLKVLGMSAMIAIVFLGVTIKRAEGAAISCSVTNINWYPGNGGTLQVKCGGVWYYGMGSAPAGCPSADADARKAWLSLAQSALLAGKTITMDYTTCSNAPYLTNLGINQ